MTAVRGCGPDCPTPDQPMATTAVTAAAHERGCRVPGHLVYRALVALKRDAEARRAGRAGTAARSEVLWPLALTISELNRKFARLVAEPVDADHAAARGAPARRNEVADERADPSAGRHSNPGADRERLHRRIEG
jgi:hypothetical protein